MIRQAQAQDIKAIEKFLKIENGVFNTLILPKDIFIMRVRCLYDIFKIGSEYINIYLVGEENSARSGLICIYGQTAFYIGAMQNANELESFLSFMSVKSFFSNDMMLSNWIANPYFLLKRSKNCKIDVQAAIVMEKPNLHELAHSGVISDINPDLYYAKVARLVKAKRADIRAIALQDNGKANFVSTAGLYCIEEEIAYLQSVETKKEHTGCGYASTLITSLAMAHANKDIYLGCLPDMHGFYERLGFNIALPLCEFVPNE